MVPSRPQRVPKPSPAGVWSQSPGQADFLLSSAVIFTAITAVPSDSALTRRAPHGHLSLNPPSSPMGRVLSPHFTDQDPEAQRSWATYRWKWPSQDHWVRLHACCPPRLARSLGEEGFASLPPAAPTAQVQPAGF